VEWQRSPLSEKLVCSRLVSVVKDAGFVDQIVNREPASEYREKFHFL
jgi:hypothetical protein